MRPTRRLVGVPLIPRACLTWRPNSAHRDSGCRLDHAIGAGRLDFEEGELFVMQLECVVTLAGMGPSGDPQTVAQALLPPSRPPPPVQDPGPFSSQAQRWEHLRHLGGRWHGRDLLGEHHR